MNDKTIIRRAHGKDNPYFIMARDLAQNKALSYEAVGMAAYLLSKPDDWEIMVIDLIREKKAGRDKVYRILRELMNAGHVQRDKKKDERGRYVAGSYVFSECPHPENPYMENPDTANPPLHNTESTDKRKKDIAPAGADAATPPKPRKRDPLFDAVQLHIFGIPLEEKVNGGRIAKISNWLHGTYEGKGSARVGFISKPAEPAHVEKFAAWCTKEGFTPPRDVVKFTEQWRKWAASANHAPKAQTLDPRLFQLPEDAHGFGLDQFVRKPEAVTND